MFQRVPNFSSAFALIAMTLILSSCSPTRILQDIGLVSSKDRVESFGCTAVLLMPYYELNLTTSRAIPAKVAIVLDGVLKYDECLSEPVVDKYPVAVPQRQDGKLKTLVRFLSTPFPTSVDYTVLDRGDCSANPTEFYTAKDIHLEFVNPPYDANHPECGGKTYATVELTD